MSGVESVEGGRVGMGGVMDVMIGFSRVGLVK